MRLLKKYPSRPLRGCRTCSHRYCAAYSPKFLPYLLPPKGIFVPFIDIQDKKIRIPSHPPLYLKKNTDAEFQQKK